MFTTSNEANAHGTNSQETPAHEPRPTRIVGREVFRVVLDEHCAKLLREIAEAHGFGANLGRAMRFAILREYFAEDDARIASELPEFSRTFVDAESGSVHTFGGAL